MEKIKNWKDEERRRRAERVKERGRFEEGMCVEEKNWLALQDARQARHAVRSFSLSYRAPLAFD